MYDIYLAQVFCEPGFYIAHIPQDKQLVIEAMMSTNPGQCQEWVQKKKDKYRVKNSRVAKLSSKRIKSMYLYEDRRELLITVEVAGNVMNDYRPRAVFFSLRGEELTPEMEQSAREFIRAAEFKRQSQWRREQKRLEKQRK